mmetsp:Transcript_39384/g.111689  ORF Transcript_39384/g.111689 Transcript_39384/m.111689 type:complete len:215 (+) Transcript_39384:966-1610(+)
MSASDASRQRLLWLSIAAPGSRTGGWVGVWRRRRGAAGSPTEGAWRHRRLPISTIARSTFQLGRTHGAATKKSGVARPWAEVARPRPASSRTCRWWLWQPIRQKPRVRKPLTQLAQLAQHQRPFAKRRRRRLCAVALPPRASSARLRRPRQPARALHLCLQHRRWPSRPQKSSRLCSPSGAGCRLCRLWRRDRYHQPHPLWRASTGPMLAPQRR